MHFLGRTHPAGPLTPPDFLTLTPARSWIPSCSIDTHSLTHSHTLTRQKSPFFRRRKVALHARSIDPQHALRNTTTLRLLRSVSTTSPPLANQLRLWSSSQSCSSHHAPLTTTLALILVSANSDPRHYSSSSSHYGRPRETTSSDVTQRCSACALLPCLWDFQSVSRSCSAMVHC